MKIILFCKYFIDSLCLPAIFPLSIHTFTLSLASLISIKNLPYLLAQSVSPSLTNLPSFPLVTPTPHTQYLFPLSLISLVTIISLSYLHSSPLFHTSLTFSPITSPLRNRTPVLHILFSLTSLLSHFLSLSLSPSPLYLSTATLFPPLSHPTFLLDPHLAAL